MIHNPILSTLLACLLTITSFAQKPVDQPTYFCGQTVVREKLYRQHPHLHPPVDTETTVAADRGGDTEVYIIPVVFHVIHDGGPENISDDQIHSAIDVLNRDFRKLNADTSMIVAAFEDLAADIDIEFRLATRDPNGDCHSGINRISDPALTYDGFNDALKELSYWPRNKYMNVWVCNTIGGTTLGFTNLPGDVSPVWLAPTDGIVVRYDCLGLIEEANVAYSRTLTHEVGHWLNLYHTWGPTNSPNDAGNCDFDDYVTDTPNTIGYVSCVLNGASCNSALDNVQNYMEYSFCSRMFTYGQRARMRAALTSNTASRSSLITQANHVATGVINPPLCMAQFQSEETSVCVGSAVQFRDDSYHGITSWTWDFGDGTVLSGSDPLVHKDPVHTYAEPGVYTVSLTVGNGTSTLSTSLNAYITVYGYGQNEAVFVEGFESTWPANNWSVFNEANNESWEVTPTASFSGDKSLKLRNFNNTVIGASDVLYSATYNMSTADTVYLSYQWAYASKLLETDDKLRVSVSGDCGQTWSLRKIRKGLTNLPTSDPQNAAFTPTLEDQWSGETLTLLDPAWFTENFRVKFEFEGLGGNNFYLDDINIFSTNGVSVNEVMQGMRYRLYPNPAEGSAYLEMQNMHSEGYQLAMYNALGALVWSTTAFAHGTDTRIEIPHHTKGLYTLNIRQGETHRTAKLIFD